MKCGGIAPALRIAAVAELSGIELMWGCMDESVICDRRGPARGACVAGDALPRPRRQPRPRARRGRGRIPHRGRRDAHDRRAGARSPGRRGLRSLTAGIREWARGAFLVATGALAASGLAAQAPSGDWRTIETPHFRIHYPAPFEAWAKRTASSIEAIHAGVTDFVGYAPPQPIDVVVADPVADPNGMAFPFLDRPVVVLWAYPPDTESGIGDYTDWMDLLSVHEVAHIAHLARPRNRAGLLSRLLPLPVGPSAPDLSAVALRGVRDAGGGSAHGIGASQLELSRDGPAALCDRGEAAFLRRAFGDVRMARRLDGVPRRLGLPRMAGGARGAGKPPEALEAHGLPARGRLLRPPFGRSSAARPRTSTTASAPSSPRRRSRRRSGARLRVSPRASSWQRLKGATFSPQVSPDGKRLLAFRAPARGDAFLAVWTLEATEAERAAEEREEVEERELLADADEVADRPEIPRPRAPRWRLRRWNGQAPEWPRWMGDGRVLFTRRVPDEQGVLAAGPLRLGGGGRRRVSCDAPGRRGRCGSGAGWRVGRRRAQSVRRFRARPCRSGDGADARSRHGRDAGSLAGVEPSARLARRKDDRGAAPREGGVEPRDAPFGRRRAARGSPAAPPGRRPGAGTAARLFFGSDASGVWELDVRGRGGLGDAGGDDAGDRRSVFAGPDARRRVRLLSRADGPGHRSAPAARSPPGRSRGSRARRRISRSCPRNRSQPRRFSESEIAAPRPYRALVDAGGPRWRRSLRRDLPATPTRRARAAATSSVAWTGWPSERSATPRGRAADRPPWPGRGSRRS